jgi:hypothetical protein
MSACEEMHERSNRFSPSIIDDIVETYHPAAILGQDTRLFDFYLFNLEGYNHQCKWCVYSLFQKNDILSIKPEDNIVIVSNKHMEDSEIYKSIEAVDNDIFPNFLSNYTITQILSSESVTNRTIEYASKYYNNALNGSCIYVYKVSYNK